MTQQQPPSDSDVPDDTSDDTSDDNRGNTLGSADPLADPLPDNWGNSALPDDNLGNSWGDTELPAEPVSGNLAHPQEAATNAPLPTGSPVESSATPYSALNPDVILDALESAGFEPNGSLVALNSFENRVYQVGLHDESFVVTKFYRPGRWNSEQIHEEHAFTQELLDAELSVVAPTRINNTSLFEYNDFQFAVFPRQGGHPPEIESEHNLAIMGRTLGRMHATGQAAEHQTRPSLDWRRMAEESRNWLLASNFIPKELLPAYESTTGHLLTGIEAAMATPTNNIRLHGDCHLGNVLWRDDVPHFVDFDDTVSGPAIQDLWMLLSGDNDDRARQLHVLIEAYETFISFDPAQLAMIEALRTMRMMYHAAWIGRRWNDPAFPPAFPWFNGGRYWADHILALREQLSALDDEPLALK